MIIECFDISNISTTHNVASMVCFKNGKPDKANYRRYRIRTVQGPERFRQHGGGGAPPLFARAARSARAEYADAAEFSQENPQEALERLARIATQRPDATPMIPTTPRRRPMPTNANLTGDILIEGPGYEPDETDAELDDEVEREIESEALADDAGELCRVTTRMDVEPDLDRTADLSGKPRKRAPAPVRLPDLVIVDGGKGQLSSACGELQRLGLHELPIIGLAKEFEEIYRPGRPRAVASAGGFGRVAAAPAHPRRGASFRQRLPSTADEAPHRRKHPGRLPRREREPQGDPAARIRFSRAPAQSERRANLRRGRHRPEAGRGCSAVFADALDNAGCRMQDAGRGCDLPQG